MLICAMQAAACNGLASTVSVVQRDVAKLQRGKDVRRRGVNLVVADMFDAGMSTLGGTQKMTRATPGNQLSRASMYEVPWDHPVVSLT